MTISINGTDQFGNDISIAAVHFSKSESKSSVAYASLYVNSERKKRIEFKAEKSNKYTGGTDGKTISIQRNGFKYIFTIGGEKYQYTNTNEFTITNISILFYKNRTTNELQRNAVNSFKFVSNPSDDASYKKEIKRLYNGDNVVVDVRTGQISIDGIVQNGYGALGNDWEEFLLNPGLNQIQCVYTDGATSPEFKMKYREVY